MNAMRYVGVSASFALMGITACNYTVGECWPVGQGGGSSGQGVTSGGGVILPGGFGGGYGDSPGSKPQDATNPKSDIKCNSDEDTESQCLPGDSADSADTLAICSDACTGKCQGGTVSGVPAYKPSNFKFVTIVEDDGAGIAGGWQQAVAKLRMLRIYPFIVEYWDCPVTIGMPLRTAVNGKIPPLLASTISATIASQAAENVRNEDPDYPQGIFCIRVKSEMITIAAKPPYNTFGVSVK